MIFVEMIFRRVRCSIKNDSDRLRRATQILIATLGAFYLWRNSSFEQRNSANTKEK